MRTRTHSNQNTQKASSGGADQQIDTSMTRPKLSVVSANWRAGSTCTAVIMLNTDHICHISVAPRICVFHSTGWHRGWNELPRAGYRVRPSLPLFLTTEIIRAIATQLRWATRWSESDRCDVMRCDDGPKQCWLVSPLFLLPALSLPNLQLPASLFPVVGRSAAHQFTGGKKPEAIVRRAVMSDECWTSVGM
jgi:hypothetical protein